MHSIKLISVTPNHMELLKRVIAVCHNKETVSDNVVQHVIDSGHLSVLEHLSATFEINISRKVLAEITRHRMLSFTVQSSRACRLTEKYDDFKHPMVRQGIENAMSAYRQALACDVPYDEASYLLPEGAMCRIFVTGNFRAFLEFLPKRTCRRAVKEFQSVAKQMWYQLSAVAPEIFTKERMMNCKKCTEKGCDFK